MADEENNHNEVQPKDVQEQANNSWLKIAGIGLVGGVVGALAVSVLVPSFQQDKILPQITAQAERTEELKADREREFSRVFNAIAELNLQLDEHNRQYELSLKNVNEALAQLRSDTQEQAIAPFENLSQATIDLGEKLAELQNNLAQLQAQVQAQANTTPASPTNQDNLVADITSLKTHVEALQQQQNDGDKNTLSQINGLSSQINDLSFSLEGLQNNMSQQFEARDLAIKDLQRDVATLSSAPPPASDQSMAMLIAANSLKSAVDRGGSFDAELQIFTHLAPSNLDLDLLEHYAASGLPNIAELSRNFASLADAIAASDNSLPENAGLADQLLHQGSQLYSSRPVGEVEGTGAAAVAARMEVAIQAGDFSRALSEASALPPEAKALAADFIDILTARQTIDKLLSQIIANALQEQDNAH